MKIDKVRKGSFILTKNESVMQYANACKFIKGNFITNDTDKAKIYIKDLEQNLAINKEIIVELLRENLKEENSKIIIEKFNVENILLQQQVRKLAIERDELLAKLLITEQIVENLKRREGECCKEVAERQKEMLDQLDRKEFNLQKLERKYEKALTVLKNLEHKDQGVRKLLKVLKEDIRIDSKLSNIVKENELLQTELTDAKVKIKELTMQVNEGLTQEKVNEEKDHIEIKSAGTPKLKKRESSSESMLTIRSLKEEIIKLNKRIEELYEINLNLSETLRSANSKLLLMSRKENMRSRSGNKSDNTYCSERNKSTTKKRVIESFGIDKNSDTSLCSPVSKINKKLLN